MAESNQQLKPPISSTNQLTDVSDGAHPLGSLDSSEVPAQLQFETSSEEEFEEDPHRVKAQLLTVNNGLKLKLQGQANPFATFSYALFPLVDKCVPVDWKPLVADDVQAQHIRCHDLQEGDELSMLVANFKAKHAKALILINTQDNYSIAPQFTEGMAKIVFPTVVLTKPDGYRLLNLLDQHEDSVFARLDAESDVDTVETRQGSSVQTTKSSTRKEGTLQGGVRQMFRVFDRTSFPLKAHFKKLMFSPDKQPEVVSKNSASISMLMVAMTKYEEKAQTDGHNQSDVKKAITKIRVHFVGLFLEDLFLYLAIAYRLHLNFDLYKCDELKAFIMDILHKTETVEPEKLAKAVGDALKRGDFEVMCGVKKEEESVSMFWYMESACQELLKVSYEYKKSQQTKKQVSQKQLPERFCYTRMMWISMALKFHSERTVSTRITARLWEDKFISFQDRIILDDAVVDDIADGLKFEKLTCLPKPVSFSRQLITDLAVSERCVRKFTTLGKFVHTVTHYLSTEDDLFIMLSEIREAYTTKIKEPAFALSNLSLSGTLTNALTEAITFLDYLIAVWKSREYSKKILDEECAQWLQLLLSQVDITGDRPAELLSKFLQERSEVCKKHRKLIGQEVVKITRKKFHQLSIQQFFTLYKKFHIKWPNKFLVEYLEQYTVPAGTKVNDATCKEFFSGIVTDFSGAHEHYYLFDYLMKISERYKEDGCAKMFILNLLQLGVPKLFSVPESFGKEQAKETRENFSKLLRNFIRFNSLQDIILGQMKKVLGLISDKGDEFQQLVLTVILHEVIPGKKVLQKLGTGNSGVPGQHFRAFLSESMNILKESGSWSPHPSPKQSFCWKLIIFCCSRIHVTNDSLGWLDEYWFLVTELVRVFGDYCTRKRLNEIPGSLLDEIGANLSSDIKRYLKWIHQIRSFYYHWKIKFETHDINYKEILLYAALYDTLRNVCVTLCSNSLLINFETVEVGTKDIFQSEFDKLNVYLLKYIPQHSDARWCSFVSLLKEYGVSLPQQLLTDIEKNVIFPDNTKVTEKEVLNLSLHRAANKGYKPSGSISLRLMRGITLKDLSALVVTLEEFHEPLEPWTNMFTFFRLNHSVMFDTYLRVELEKDRVVKTIKIEESQSTASSSISTVFRFKSVSMPSAGFESSYKSKTVLVTDLQKSLEKTEQLLMRIVKGKAAYIDIIANGRLNLEKLDIEEEFNILNNYASLFEITQSGFENLAGVYSLLELFQYSKHIKNIRGVCEQYQLKVCLHDKQLERVQLLVDNVRLEELTPKDASERMNVIKTLLCINRSEDASIIVDPKRWSKDSKKDPTKKRSACLEVFPAVADSAEFYQFIKDKQFYGEKGQATFHQQYQLITAQLQHEEYDESVLNHLLAAFKVMTPFMDDGQSFEELMSKVTDLDTTFGRKQLETVNGNITTIRLWFSKAEGDTLQNVAKELDIILKTGSYSFKLPIDGAVQMTLEYTPSASQTTSITDGKTSGGLGIVSQTEPKLEVIFPKPPKQEQWNFEQIGDFVRKLGFMDTEKEGGDRIKHFRHISGVAYHLLELYGQLKDLGNPLYIKGAVDSLPCSTSRTDADSKKRKTEATLEGWRKSVTELRSQYDWLLFFSIPKILRLHNLLSNRTGEQDELDKIVCEISFLCCNDEPTRDTLRTYTLGELEKFQKGSGKSPMEVVGQFLGDLFTAADLQLPMRTSSSSNTRPSSHEFTQQLHYCPNYSQSQLIQTIVGICKGVPEAFELFHCQPSTTEEELSLFLKRAARHSLRSIVLEVNKLPFKLQESLMQLHVLVQTCPGFEENSSELTTLAALRASPCIHFIETEPSVLRDVPWIQLREHKEPYIGFEAAQKLCREGVVLPKDFSCIQLVVGAAGDGKTHYIKEQLRTSPAQLTIAVNEAFTPLKAIFKLRTLPINQWGASVFFNFTMLPPGDSVDESERKRFEQLMEVIGWFFFDLLILGYVEDPTTGISFRIPGGLEWAIYIEIPSRKKDISFGEVLDQFREEVPTLSLLGTVHIVRAEVPYTVDDDVQLVCKYLQAYDNKQVCGRREIDRLYGEDGTLVKFSLVQDLTAEQCHRLLNKHMPDHIRSTKITQRLFVKYMKRRCEFLDKLSAFNYNNGGGEYITDRQGERILTNTRKLGSTLMNTMLKEVSDFCDPAIKANWSMKPHQQLIYDYKDCGGSFGLISLQPQNLPEEEKTAFENIGVEVPSMIDLRLRKELDKHLSRALNIQLENERLRAIDDSAYVLTLDYTIKMLNIHERYECGVPVIIEGETGVGKTALIDMLSKLWNQSLLVEWMKQRGRIMDFFVQILGEISADISSEYELCLQTIHRLHAGEYVGEDRLLSLCKLPKGSKGHLYTDVQTLLNPMQNDPVVAQLSLEDSPCEDDSLEKLFIIADKEKSAEATAKLLHAVLCATIKPTFHKINVHAAMTPAEIEQYFKPAFEQAKELRDAYQRSKKRALLRTRTANRSLDCLGSSNNQNINYSFPEEEEEFMHRMPFVTVFLDEVNTSSCLGIFKEIIVDRTIDGKLIPENVFIVAACNPHRGNSMASLGIQGGSESDREKWVRGTYYVRKLHPTLRFLMWDYGSLDEHQEKEYINAKMRMLNKDMSNPEVDRLSSLIVGSQKQMRKYAYEQIKSNMNTEDPSSDSHATLSSQSCVSQRDIQRVFTFYQWFMKVYKHLKPHGENCPDYTRRAVLVALGIVYYLRLNNQYRKEYTDFLDKLYECRLPGDVTFVQAFDEELDWYINLVELPKGIARTQALKENIFGTIVCTVTHTPLIIVGAPGSSKTLSFNQTIANLKGAESRVKEFRNASIFRSLDPHYYQCSRRTTSIEIQTVFSRAINRQQSHSRFNLPIYCVVFMDEAGLPEESHESLKVLHYHLDKQIVSFVAITNHVLDAAKTNRAVSLFRPEASDKDLETLAKGCFCSDRDDPRAELKEDVGKIVSFCRPYCALMKDKSFSRFFGLRDFIHFINYLRRKHDENQSLNSQVVMEAIERNFNGNENFEAICTSFLGKDLCEVRHRDILDILKSSLQDRPQEIQGLSENEVRYKLIIDPSEDDSLVRLLFTFEILQRDNTRVFVCSNFPADSHLQKINTIAAIRHSAIEGHTVVMSQTDDIHESFYDLFNQRFRRIDDVKEGPRYYTNIAIGAHLKPSRVNLSFQCVVVVKKSEIKNTPAPFLNRFEKYLITHQTMLETALNRMPPNISVIIRAAIDKVNDFIQGISGSESLYGLCPDTLNSLVISLLPSINDSYKEMSILGSADDSTTIEVFILQNIVQSLREYTGLFIPKYAEGEFNLDVDSIFELVTQYPNFKSIMQNMNHLTAAQAITEAINVLHLDTEKKHIDVSPEGCLIIAVLQQWLVRYLCKRLMQLMTSEALILHRNKIPLSYLRNYLNFQTHFSLKKLVESYHGAAECTKSFSDSATCRSATKILCFTRSSPLIHQLPAEFPSSALGKKMEEISREKLEKIVFGKVDKLMVCKLSFVISQTTIQELIKEFLNSEKAKVFLLVINMQETSKEIVNHIRIMIEEAEALSKQKLKLFVVLLHFPPAQFFRPCYSSLYLKGWDHCYLDTIAHSSVDGVVDIRDWFWQCCFPQHSSQLEEDTLLQALHSILPQAIPVLVSRVFFGSRENCSFNRSMNGHERTKVLNRLLEKGQGDVTVGRILCEKFRAYWKPSEMAEQLEKAAIFSRNRESTLNITESIQTNFKSLFFDFLVYMISRINENYNLDILLNPDCSDAEERLFLEILRLFPTSKLHQIALLSNNVYQSKPPEYTPKFPFFRIVFEIMERIVEQSREDANVQLDILSEITTPLESKPNLSEICPSDINDTLFKATTTWIAEKMEDSVSKKEILELVFRAISEHNELWNRYFFDFIWYKFQVDSFDSSKGIVQEILFTFLGHLHHYEARERIIRLHIQLNICRLDLAKLVSLFRPIDKLIKLHVLSDASMHSQLLTSGTPTSPSMMLQSIVEQTKYQYGSPEHITTFVVTTLFDALVGFLYPHESFVDSINDNMIVWHNVFRDMMTLPNLKQYVYSALQGKEMNTIEAKLNLMQALFLTLQSSPDLEQDNEILCMGQQVFRTLYNGHFNKKMELVADSPQLSTVTKVVLGITTSAVTSSSASSSAESDRVILEGLLAHFFAPERQHYHTEDIHWFLCQANSQNDWGIGQVEETPNEIPSGVLSLNVFKLYLSKILGQYDSSKGSTDSDPLMLYDQFPRNEIGVVLTTKIGSPPGPFIPKFYMDCPFIRIDSDCEHPCMQQPLAHLYFLTVLEHLMNKPYKLSGLVTIALGIIIMCTSEPISDASKVVLYIELQAVLQVTAQQLALHLDPLKPEKIEDIVSVLEEINKLMNNPTTGGGIDGGHGIVVVLNILKHLRSSRKLSDLLVKKYDSMIRGINCLESFHVQAKTHSDTSVHLLPFMSPTCDNEMVSLYNTVKEVMSSIHEDNGSVDSLKQLAEKCAQPSKEHSFYLRDSFKMMVWLVTYYEFFNKKVTSKILCDILGSPEMFPYLKEEGYVRMIQCFLLPELMINRKMAPNVHHIDTSDRRHLPNDVLDPVYELFTPSNPEKQDEVDSDLCHTLANLVAVVMGCPSQSNHLWFHMFTPKELVNSYMTGFMYNSKISPDGLQYDCGVELTAEGEFGRSDYLKHAGRGTYTLHSLYLILWANFGAFTMSLLTLPDADAQISGNLISERKSIRHYCVSQLRAIWQHMRNNLALSNEERTLFVNQCLEKFLKVVNGHQEELLSELPQPDVVVRHCARGIFATLDDLDHYEKMWHLDIYQPTWNDLQGKLADYSSHQQNDLFTNLRYLDVHYPHFPSVADFVHCILCYGDLEQHSEGGELRAVSDFAQSWRVLQAGGLLLPDLVEFYQWLHTELAHLVTYDEAINVSIQSVVEVVSKRYGSQDILTLYEGVKKGYNEYVKLIGGAIGAGACAALKQGNKIFTIEDDTPLLHFLTDSEEEDDGNDWLFTVIAHIVATHNQTVDTLFAVIRSQDRVNLSKLIPDQLAKVSITEVTKTTCIIGNLTSLHGISSLLQVIRSRYQPPSFKFSASITQRPDAPLFQIQTRDSPKFQLRYLEEDLIRLFSAGKPHIESPFSIRVLFKFKQSHSAVPANVIGVTLDPEEIGKELPIEYKQPLSKKLRKNFEYKFHSCGYNSLIMVITALRTVCSHLTKVVMKDARSFNKEDLIDLSLPKFMVTYVYEHLTDPEEVLSEIGITPNSLKHSQLALFIELPLPAVFTCFQLFVQWVDEGAYDFCNLPFALKTHLSEADHIFLGQELRDQWIETRKGTLKDLEAEVKQMIEVLRHSEGDITKRVDEQKPTTSIVQYLKKYLLIEETDKLPPLIPDTVVVHHYVHFRMALTRLLIQLRAELEGARDEKGQTNQWSEFVTDLMSTRLSHLREETLGDGEFVNKGPYGFQNGSLDVREDFMADLKKTPYEGEKVEDQGSARDEVDSSMDLNEEETAYSELIQSTDVEKSNVEKEHQHSTEGLTKEQFVSKLRSEEDPGSRKMTNKEKEPTKVKELDSEVESKLREGPDQPMKAKDEDQQEQSTKNQTDESDLESKLEQDPNFRKKFVSVAQHIMEKEKETVLSKARKYTPEDVGDFLSSIKLDKYKEEFVVNEVGGDVLLDSDSEVLSELGVVSPLDRVRILTLFPRRLREAEPSYPVSEVVKFLMEKNLGKYSNLFEDNQIDGDMMLDAEPELMKSALKEIGIGLVDRVKILSKFKTFVSS